jgi:SAM-dependent methyltransferase
MNFKSPWTQILYFLAFILAIFVFAQTFHMGARGLEGFQQMRRYEMRRDADAYDDFYADIHDKLYQVADQAKFESEILYSNTQMDGFSRVLDLGCGTGHVVSDLAGRGVASVVGVDRSEAMVKRNKSNVDKSNVEIKQLCDKDMSDPMAFEKGQFTHILALNRELYKHKDKVAFFRKCNHWLIPGGYLIVQVIDPMKFDYVVPLAKTGPYKSKSTNDKSTKTSAIQMIDMEYKSTYSYEEHTKTLQQVETMTDGATGKVRQNEHAFYMDNAALQHAQYAGFSVLGEYSYKTDANQRMVILRKM